MKANIRLADGRIVKDVELDKPINYQEFSGLIFAKAAYNHVYRYQSLTFGRNTASMYGATARPSPILFKELQNGYYILDVVLLPVGVDGAHRLDIINRIEAFLGDLNETGSL